MRRHSQKIKHMQLLLHICDNARYNRCRGPLFPINFALLQLCSGLLSRLLRWSNRSIVLIIVTSAHDNDKCTRNSLWLPRRVCYLRKQSSILAITGRPIRWKSKNIKCREVVLSYVTWLRCSRSSWHSWGNCSADDSTSGTYLVDRPVFTTDILTLFILNPTSFYI